MTGSRPDPELNQPDDLDPTGVRSLLANLPAPGPMPDELVARIAQSLELEQQRRSAGGPNGYPGRPGGTGSASDLTRASGSDGPSVVSLDAERQRRRPGRTVLWLGGAAAVAMVATLSVNQLIEGDGDAGVSAQVPAGDSADAGSEAGTDGLDAAPDGGPEDEDAELIPDQPAAEAPVPDDSAADGSAADESAGGADEVGAQDDAGEEGDAGTAALSVFAARGVLPLSTTEWGDEVSSWVAAGPDRGTTSWTSRDALECVTAHDLDVADARQLMMSDASWDQTPAVLLVTEEPESATAWVLTPDCGEILSGPLTVPR